MSSVGKIEKKTNTRFLNFYEFEAIHRVVFDIDVNDFENKKLGDGGAVTNETVGANGDITYTNSTEKLPVINLYKAGSTQISQTFYLDDFIAGTADWTQCGVCLRRDCSALCE